jgi:hypothetical protein
MHSSMKQSPKTAGYYGVTIDGCQIPGYQRLSEGEILEGSPSLVRSLKRALARPWNYIVKPHIKSIVRAYFAWRTGVKAKTDPQPALARAVPQIHFQTGDLVLVRSREEIEATLDPFKELKGCAFLDAMWQYCGTQQRVLQPMNRFLDERDYKVKKAKGIVLLEGVLCRGTPVFGQCDRACHLFWREEWLEKVSAVSELTVE